MLNNLIGKVENTENSINDILNYKTIRNSYATANVLDDGTMSTVNSYNFKHFKDSKDLYDQPGYFIFKLVFYFDDANGSEGLSGFEGGLLGGVSQKSEDEANDISSLEETTGNNSALYFLLANGEYERAEYLNTFLELSFIMIIISFKYIICLFLIAIFISFIFKYYIKKIFNGQIFLFAIKQI